jgi:hypothetical protein
MDHEVKENIKNRTTWTRLLYMLLLVILYSVAELVISAVVFFQIVVNLFTGESNERLLLFGNQLSRYVYEILLYLTYNSENLPFPFSEWPSSNNGVPQSSSKPPP